MLEWLGDVGPIILATVAIIIAIWQSHGRTHDKIDARFDKVDNRFDNLENKIEARFDKVDNRFDNLENKIEARFDKVEDKLSHLEQDMSEMKGMLKVFINGKHTN